MSAEQPAATYTEPGFYPGVPERVYRALPHENQSNLKGGPTPAHLRHARETVKEPTASMLLGTALHVAVWEPASFRDRVVVKPSFNGEGAHARRRAWELANADSVVLTTEQLVHCRGMYAAVMAHPDARALIDRSGWAECVAVWDDEQFPDVRCKARADWITKVGSRYLIVDLKTTDDASEFGFVKSCANFGYHQQDSWYTDGFGKVLAGEVATCFVAVENTPPYAVAIYELNEEARAVGRAENFRALEWVRRGKESGVWPGYPGGISTVGLPRWKVASVNTAIEREVDCV